MGEPEDHGRGGARPPSDPDQQSTDLWDVDELEQTPIVSPDFSESHTRDLSQTLKPGKTWGRYDLGDQLGAGGMGVVYRALDPTLLRPVALKFLRYIDAKQSERFFREARAQARIKHPHICEIYEAGVVDGEPFIAMQFIDGEDLGMAALQMRLEELLQLMSQVAEAIHAAHRLGLVHRDLKPGNVMVEELEDGGWHPYVMDFGLVRDEYAPDVTATGTVLGTLHYMAPEQAAGEKHRIDRRTDVYSMGAMLYRLLLKRPLFKSTDKMAHVVQILREEPPRPRAVDPSLPEDVETIILKCLEKRPEDRYPSAKALADDLQHYLDGEPIDARPVGPVQRLIKKARKNRALTTVVAVATAAVLTITVVAVFGQLRAAQQTRLARQFGEDANDIEWIMRVAHMAPLHDIRPEQEQVRERMADIEARMKSIGPAAQGPGHYAIGRGHLALGDYDEAREHLERAWELGQQGDDVSYALGLACGRLYEAALNELDSISDDEIRELRRAEMQVTLRDPAVRYLLEGQSTELADTEYVEGLLALYEMRYDTALSKARSVFERSPTFYEAAILEGSAQMAIGSERALEEDAGAALAAFGEADVAFREAVAVGRSDAEGYERLCETQLRAFAARVYQPDHSILEQELACQQALQVEPGRPSTLLILAKRRVYEGRVLLERGEDPSKLLASAVLASYRVIRVEPGNQDALLWHAQAFLEAAEFSQWGEGDARVLFQAAIASLELATSEATALSQSHDLLGRAYQGLAVARWQRGEDPLGDWERAIAAHEKALSLNRTSTFLSDLAVVYLSRAQCPWTPVEQRRKDADRAIEIAEEALALNPEAPYAVPYAHVSIGTAYGVRAGLDLDVGADPSADVERAISHLDRALQAAPGWSFPLMMQGWCLATQAEHQRLRGEDPGPTIVRALGLLDEAAETGSEMPDIHESRALLFGVRARHSLDLGDSPQLDIDAAREAQSRALVIDPGAAELLIGAAAIEVLQARWDVVQRRSPALPLERARTSLTEALRLEPGNADAHAALAESHLVMALWEQAKGRTPDPAMAEGLAEVGQALEINPAFVHAMALRDELGQLSASEGSVSPRR